MQVRKRLERCGTKRWKAKPGKLVFATGVVTTGEGTGGGVLGETGARVTHIYNFWAGIKDRPRKAEAAYVNGPPRCMGLAVVRHAYEGAGHSGTRLQLCGARL